MALNSKLIQRITKTTSADVVHSTGYAQAQNGGNIGAIGGGSFESRQNIESDRKMVQAYRNARVAQGVNWMPKAMSVEEQKALDAMQAAVEKSKHDNGRQESNSRLEAGGLRRFDREANKMSASDSVSKTRGFGRTSAAEMRNNRQAAAANRAAQAERFSGGIKKVSGSRPTTNHQMFGR